MTVPGGTVMPEDIKKSSKLPPLKNDTRAVLYAKQSLHPSTSEITPNTATEDVIRILKAKGAHQLAAAVENADTSRKRKKNPTQEQMDLDLGDTKKSPQRIKEM